MKRLLSISFVLVALLGISLMGCGEAAKTDAAKTEKTAETAKTQVDPKNPAATSNPTHKTCYSCPTHTDVCQEQAGKCPICGAELVSKTCTEVDKDTCGACSNDPGKPCTQPNPCPSCKDAAAKQGK